MNDIIRFIKLLSGEELIAEIQDSDDDTTTLKNPVAIAVHPQDGGRVMVPWIPYSDDIQYVIKNSSIVLISSIRNNLLDAYEEKFSGIVRATPQQTQILTQ